MTKINLLDWRAERRKRREQQFYALLAVSLLTAVAAVGGAWFYMQGAIEFQQQRNQFLQDQIVETERKIKEIEELEKVKNNLLARMKVIEELQASRSATVHFFDELINTLPEGVFLTSIKQNNAEGKFRIEGTAESNGRVSTYIRNLEASGWFAEPNLEVIRTGEKNRQRKSDFILIVKNLTKATDKPPVPLTATVAVAKTAAVPVVSTANVVNAVGNLTNASVVNKVQADKKATEAGGKP
jgi:type IV pilus assembly protein PilN